ncbi:MAG: hypothetical protein JO261_05445 [Alphaproteobacteria bacterium]|nr:hypothetical protein [Alphaproteobacteria bacterium]MBV9693126.1 hypothetical protein [Alphaproteobacteria bacterium]
MRKTLSALLILGALVTAFYWWSYFAGGDVMVLHARWYTAFESSFPVADAWMALGMVVAGIGLWRGTVWGARAGLMAGSALVYLACMDITFDVENGMYALAASNDAMKFEIFINATTLLLGAWTIVACWNRAE